jgi:hypothetical protein
MTVRERIRGWMPVLVAGGVLAVGGVVAIPLGGWDTVELQSEIVPEWEAGEPYAGTRLITAIDDLYLTDFSPDGYSEAEPGETFLVVVVTMEAAMSEPQLPLIGRSFPPFVIPGVIDIDRDLDFSAYTIVLKRDGTYGPELNPGVPDTLLFAFTVRESQFEGGDEVPVGIVDADAEDADIYEGTRWVNVEVVVEVPMTVRDER